MKFPYRHALSLLTGAIAGAGLAWVGAVSAADPAAPPALPFEELRAFTEILERVRHDYVEPVDDRKLLESAVRGMLAGLDPHSSYLDREGYREMQVGTTGEFGGLGIEVGQEDGFVKVISPIDDTPAARAGIRAGDLIVRIDDTPTKGLGLADSVKLMRGSVGSSVKLTVVRAGEDKPLEITLTRDVITVRSVKSRALEPGYGYVRITQFQSRTAGYLREQLATLKQAGGGRLKGLVLDLRNNPGGVLSGAVEVADAFLDSGLIVYTEGRESGSRQNFQAGAGDLIDGVPLVVLVNGGSASASEIVAGVLQDQRRAVIMGTRTFGKGSVQTIMPLADGTAVKLTTARYYTPSGRSIQAQSIEPDIRVDAVRVTGVEAADTVKEADLAGHLNNPGQRGNETGGAGEADPAQAAPAGAGRSTELPLVQSDYALAEALNLLKGLALLGRK